MPVSACPWVVLLSWSPITGKWTKAESSTLVLSVGLSARTMSSTVTNTSSSGNSEANP